MNNTNPVGLLRKLIDHGRLVWRLMFDRRVPLFLKALPVLAVAYLVWPIDILPDMLPVLGQLDDLAAIVLGLETFIALCPPDVVAGIRAELSGEAPFSTKPGETIDGQWKE